LAVVILETKPQISERTVAIEVYTPGITGRLAHLKQFFIASRPALGYTRPTIQFAAGPLSLGVKRPGHETDHTTPRMELYLHSLICLYGIIIK
jgi:hypothetical protein